MNMDRFVDYKEFDKLSERVEKLEKVFNDSPKKVISKKESPSEFLKKYATKKDIDKYAIFMFYFESINNSFADNKEIKTLFRQAKQKIPTNLTLISSRLQKKAWIDCEDEKNKTYYLTQTGLEGLEKIKLKKEGGQ